MTSCNSFEDVAVQVGEQHPVDVQRVVTGEPGGCEQREDVFEGPQRSRWPLPERGGQRSSDQKRHHVRVGEGQLAEAVGDGAQLAGPVRVGGVHRQLREDDLGDAVEHCGLVGDVPVEHHRIPAHCVAEAADGQSVHIVAVDDPQRRLQDHRPAELTVVSAGGRDGQVTVIGSRVGLLGCLLIPPLPFCRAASSSKQRPDIGRQSRWSAAGCVVDVARATFQDQPQRPLQLISETEDRQE